MPYIDLQHNPEQAVIFVLENHSMLSLWNFLIYIFFGVLLTLLIIVLHQQVAPDQPLLAQFSSAMGMVWVGLAWLGHCQRYAGQYGFDASGKHGFYPA